MVYRKKGLDVLKVVNNDKYYTNEGVVKRCLALLDLGDSGGYDLIIEPSAGNGAFFNHLPVCKTIGLDIEPEGSGIKRYDWFKYKIESRHKKVLVVGNPPFGRFQRLSDGFLEHAFSADNVYTVAFILPNVYKKYTKQKIIPNEYRIKKIIDIGKSAFTFEGKSKHIPCSFFIFEKSKGLDRRDNPFKYKDKVPFTFNKYDYDLFLFGAAPKRIITNPKPNNRGHFLKSKIHPKQLKENLQNIKWETLSSASGGVFWLTQGEIIQQYYKKYK